MLIKCKWCEGVFQASNYKRKYCCKECQREAWKLNQIKKPAVTESSLDEINRKAREAGMSYGKYVALQYIKEHRNDSTM